MASEAGACTTPTSIRGSTQPASNPDAPPAASPIAIAIGDVAAVVLREEGEAGGASSGRRRRRAAAQVSYIGGGRVAPQEDTKERALKAMRCALLVPSRHRHTDRSTLRTKADWAKEFGIDRPRFTYWERHIGEDTIDAIKRDVIPLPDRPPSASGEQRSYARAYPHIMQSFTTPTLMGGDFNCVENVEADTAGSGPTPYANIHGNKWGMGNRNEKRRVTRHTSDHETRAEHGIHPPSTHHTHEDRSPLP